MCRCYNPMELSSVEEAARAQFEMENDFGIPKKPHENTEVGRRVNELRFQQMAAMRDEFGWHGTTREQLRRECGLS